MQIDNYAQAMDLHKKLEACLPFQVRPGKQFLKMMQQQGKSFSADQDLTVDKIFYGGDEGGITCTLHPEAEAKEVFAVSITHLIIDPSHPFADEVRDYQRQRTQKLKIQDQRGFAAEVMAQEQYHPKRRHRGGFGH